MALNSAFFNKVILHPYLYIVHFSKASYRKTLLFIHGGPGFNCGALEFLIQNENLFSSLNCNIVLYDQRGCGKSKSNTSPVTHQDNLEDLNKLITHLAQHGIKIDGLIGHSYGAKLLYDFYKHFNLKLPAIFVGIADSMLTPRLNNLIADFNYLKKTNPEKYQEILAKFDNDLTLEKLWSFTEELSPLFAKNADRPFNAWANLDWMKKVNEIQKTINLPMNQNILMSVRKDLYSNKANCEINISSLNVPYLWINGFHDYIMNGGHDFYRNNEVKLFYQSGHYPHIEENAKFCEAIHNFIEKVCD